MKKILLIILISLLILGVGIYFFYNNQKSQETNNPVSQQKNQTQKESSVVKTGKTVEITYENNAFSPQNVTINSGDTVKFVVKNGLVQVASNPHPTHTGYADFDSLVTLKAGQTYEFTFTKTGSFGFHNHLKQSEMGTIFVK